MTTNSLAFRLFATAAAWNLLVLPIAGAIIYSLYRQEVETSFDRRLGVLLTVVLSDTIDHGDERAGRRPRTSASRCSRSRIRAGTGRSSRSTASPAACSTSRSLAGLTIPLPSEHKRRAQRARGALGQPRRPAASRGCASPRPSTCSARARRRSATPLPSPARWARWRPASRNFRTRLDAGAGAGRRRPARRHPVPDPLRPACRWPRWRRAWPPSARARRRGSMSRLPAGDRAAAAGAQRAPQVQPGHRRARPHPRRQPGARPEDAARRHHQRGARGCRARSRARSPSRPRSWPTRSISTSTAPAWRRASASSAASPRCGPVGESIIRALERIYRDKQLSFSHGLPARRPLPGRAPGPGGDAGQPAGQRLQVGALQGDAGGRRRCRRRRQRRRQLAARSASTTTGRA